MYVKHQMIEEKTVEVRDYQQVIANSCIERSTLVVLPTGLGKTVIALLVIAEFLRTLDETGKRRFYAKLVMTGKSIDRAGFNPVEIISALRTEGEQVYVVDCGEDLGSFSDGVVGNRTTMLVQQWLASFSPSADSSHQ